MKKSLKEKKTSLEDIFSRPKSINRKAWDLIHDFYHLVFTHMDKNNISESDLARKLSISRSAVSQMFNKTPNITIKKMIEIASAIGVNIQFNLETGDMEVKETIVTVVQSTSFHSDLYKIYDAMFKDDPTSIPYDDDLTDVKRENETSGEVDNDEMTGIKTNELHSSDYSSQPYGNVAYA
ncbi:MAG: helix-turn-helix domain-containing protein [Planctomycetia bacterium]|nr:helix-turn-helix domain-containing protein [Planctomycetia bacterium]